MFFALLFVYL